MVGKAKELSEEPILRETLKGIPGIIKQNTDERVQKWQRLQYGMFIHWGLYSEIGGVWNGEPVTKGYNEQIQMWANISDSDYLDIAISFSADKFDPKEICSLAKEAGMKYIVITSKHHDGFSMFKTDTTDYNIVDSTPYAKDPLKLLAEECRHHGLKLGIYFSLIDWHQGHEYDLNNCNPIPESMESIIEEQLRELLTNYGPIAELWFDMSFPTIAQSKKFANIVHELQPGAVVNSRIWNNIGDFRTLGDNEVPSVALDGPWQTPASIYHSTWGYRSWQERTDLTGKVKELVKSLVRVRANGGNYLLNIGPRGDGSIVEYEADVLRGIGAWLDRHQDSFPGLSATHFEEQNWGMVMGNEQNLFLYVTDWPESGELQLPGLATNVKAIVEDGSAQTLSWSYVDNNLVITLPEKPSDEILPVIKIELDGEPLIIPERTISYIDGKWTIQNKDLYYGHGYADNGCYTNMVQTKVRLTSYLATEVAGNISIKLKGDAKDEAYYAVQVGNKKQNVTGKKLTETLVGPFPVEANRIVPVTITLAEPSHAGEDLNLRFDLATITITNR